MIKDLSILIPEKNDPYNRIKKFMSNEESGVVLTKKEELMLSRWIYANSLLTENKYSRQQIEEKIVEKFGCSVFTARNDINHAYSLFVQVTTDYKRFTLYHHVEQLKKLLQSWMSDKSMAAYIPRLAHEITLATKELPALQETPNLPAPIIVIDVVGDLKPPTVDIEKAREEADEIIKLEDKDDFIDYEEVKQ